jgi:hypothetical protein
LKFPFLIYFVFAKQSTENISALADYKVAEKGQPGEVGSGEKKFYAQIPVPSGE